MTPLRLAVIGAGHLGRIHARLARDLDGTELVGVADVSPRARADIIAEHGVPAVEDYHDLLGRIDAAIIATPTCTHCGIGSELLRAGVPLFIEKPLAPSLNEAEQLVQLAAKRGLVLQVGHVERFNPALEAAWPLLHDVKFITAERLSGYPARSTDVGVVLDLMIHDLDIAQAVVAAPVRRVDALGVAVVGPHEDIATARIEFENGCVANLTASRVSYVRRRLMHLFSPAGHVALDLAARQASAVALRRPPVPIGQGEGDVLAGYLSHEEVDVEERNAIAEEQREFVASVRGDAQPRVSGAAGRDAMALAERVLDSIARHQWDGHDLGRVGPHAVPSDSILRPAAWQAAPTEPTSRRAAG